MNSALEQKIAFISLEFFEVQYVSPDKKRKIFSTIIKLLKKNNEKFVHSIQEEIKFTEKDAQKEVKRAIETFRIAIRFADGIPIVRKKYKGKIIIEKRRPRGPLLAITPFSSPLSSPSHKIACGIIASTSILFKPSSFCKRTGKLLFEIIKKATHGHYIELLNNVSQQDLEDVVKDERLGIISFTGSYEKGTKIIQWGGVKKYHMELSGGNSAVIFAPDFKKYNDTLLDSIVDGIIAKNGQRCISIKHIFIPKTQQSFVLKLVKLLLAICSQLAREGNVVGPLITEAYAQQTQNKILAIVKSKNYESALPWNRKRNFAYPALYIGSSLTTHEITSNLRYDLPGPVAFVYFYSGKKEYEDILNALRNDYIYSGLQLSLFTHQIRSMEKLVKNLLWGGIIVNDIPTYRSDLMSFGGFGRAGLGKEGFLETIFAFTDPQVVVIPRAYEHECQNMFIQ